ncbi:DUF3303 domain-containing protein [Roseateles violae]|uniref:DUF3303 family protein n=1 Tax=Roseateles violae TaxID=3058042 RepID=A0ABT8DQG1_9BURK|nr:DUF3303 family protein [Pelomonas sp. PFR6]MDN3919290.1 DUF3303 family protein [Pelomonas sp. PFR6]
MKYLISWTIPQDTFTASASRFLETGGAPPPGVKLLGRWHGMSGQGFAVAESDDGKAMYLYRAQWADVLTIQVTPCLDDAEAGPVIASLLKR